MYTIRLIFGVLLIFSICHSQEKSFVIKGSLFSFDGKPLQVADVHVLSNAPRVPRYHPQGMRVSHDGTFRLIFHAPGLYRLQFSGVNHYALEVPLVVQDTDSVLLTVQLKAYELLDSLPNVRIIGNFDGIQTMAKQANGTYSVTVLGKADTLAYQLVGVEKQGRTVNGTQSDYFIYDGRGNYYSVVRTRVGPTTIAFDPRLLKGIASEPRVIFQNEKSVAARFFAFHTNVEKCHDLAELPKLSETETDPLLRNAWLLARIHFGALSRDSTLLASAFELISHTSPLWSYNPAPLLQSIFRRSDADKYIPYLQKLVAEHPDREIKPFLIETLLSLARKVGRDSLIPKYYQMLVSEFEDSPWTQSAKARFAPNRAIQVGRPAPEFSVVSLEDSSTVYTKKSLLGNVYLIDLWAVWCGPCVAEMKYLHEANGRFRSKGLKILSVSFDFKPDDVRRFRRDKWTMPWMHAFVGYGSESEFAKSFEALTIPKPVLIGRDGIILATEESLRGEKLLETLSRIFTD